MSLFVGNLAFANNLEYMDGVKIGVLTALSFYFVWIFLLLFFSKMINSEILKLALNTTNVGLKNIISSHRISLKNSICGDKITLEIIDSGTKIKSMKYETESCVFCEASASLLSKKIINSNTKNIKRDFNVLKKISKQKSFSKYQKNTLILKN